MDSRAQFNIGKFHVKRFLKWIVSSNTIPRKKVSKMARAKASALPKMLKPIISKSFSNSNIQEIRIEQVWWVLRIALAVATNAKKDHRVLEFFCTLFHAVQASVTLTKVCQFVETILNSARRAILARLVTTVPAVYKNQIIF